MNKFQYLVLSGGAQHGTLFLGGLSFLELSLGKNLLDHFKGFAGTSVGALILLCVVCEVDQDDLDPILQVPLQNLSSVISSKLKEILNRKCGNENVTFLEFFKQTSTIFKVCACDLNNLSLKIFSSDDTPNISVFKAIMASIALPFIFDPIIIDEHLFIDGGCQMNLPVGLFPFHQTLAFWIQMKHETMDLKALQKPGQYFKRVIETFFYAQDTVIETFLVPKRNIVCFEANHPGFCFQKHIDTCQLKKLGAKTLQNHFQVKYIWNLYDIIALLTIFLLLQHLVVAKFSQSRKCDSIKSVS